MNGILKFLIRSIYFYFSISAIMFSSCSPHIHNPLPVVQRVDIEKYSGRWYEIARLPNSFEKGLECITATYSLRPDGKIEVINAGHNAEDHRKIKKVKGKAWLPDKGEPGKLKVSFFWPFAGKYWILYLDENYNHVLVGHPNRKYLWILCRNKTMDEINYSGLIVRAKSLGFETEKLVTVKQDCE